MEVKPNALAVMAKAMRIHRQLGMFPTQLINASGAIQQ
jgi:hypothetical protein